MMEKIKKIIPKKVFASLQPAYHFLLSFFAALFYRFPSRRLVVIGVTGTSGKTSTAYLIYKMLNEAGFKTGLTSTAVFSDGAKEWLNDKKMTMPGRFFIQKMLKTIAANDCQYAVIETTSEGIKQYRHRFINYDLLTFTNLYPEHIESHGSFKKYKQAKGKLFSHLSRFQNKWTNESGYVKKVKNGLKKIDYNRIKKTIIANGDDKQANYFLDFFAESKWVYSLDNNFNLSKLENNLEEESSHNLSLVKGKILKADVSGLDLEINNHSHHFPLLGDFNTKNILAAYTVGLACNIEPDKLITALGKIKSLAGKMELIDVGQNFLAMVDYSFEPKALENLYRNIKLFSYNRLIHILGSTGGGRDKSRRQVLGEMAAKNADIVIVSNEDPYDENPEQIIAEVAKGAELKGKIRGENLYLISDRREALEKAAELASENDLVLATGKGAEQYICVAGGRKIPWDERKELARAIKKGL